LFFLWMGFKLSKGVFENAIALIVLANQVVSDCLQDPALKLHRFSLGGPDTSAGKNAQGGETAVSQKHQIPELKILDSQIRLNHCS
jgi:hypothetical protein